MFYTWKRYGGYECSSKGDKRFSAFYAKLKDGRTIEEAYQLDVKGYRKFGNSPMLGKGKPPLKKYEGDALWLAYLDLWWKWCGENPHMLLILKDLANMHNGILSDMFANTPINQAHALSVCLNKM